MRRHQQSPKQPRPIEVEGTEYATARAAVEQAARTPGSSAIRLEGRNLVVRREEVERLAASGRYFAHLCDHHGLIVTVPVNG
jgi:hypothetical protein